MQSTAENAYTSFADLIADDCVPDIAEGIPKESLLTRLLQRPPKRRDSSVSKLSLWLDSESEVSTPIFSPPQSPILYASTTSIDNSPCTPITGTSSMNAFDSMFSLASSSTLSTPSRSKRNSLVHSPPPLRPSPRSSNSAPLVLSLRSTLPVSQPPFQLVLPKGKNPIEELFGPLMPARSFQTESRVVSMPSLSRRASERSKIQSGRTSMENAELRFIAHPLDMSKRRKRANTGSGVGNQKNEGAEGILRRCHSRSRPSSRASNRD